MLFDKLNTQVDITINGINFNPVFMAKFVVVLIDEKLNWKDNVANHNSKYVLNCILFSRHFFYNHITIVIGNVLFILNNEEIHVHPSRMR